MKRTTKLLIICSFISTCSISLKAQIASNDYKSSNYYGYSASDKQLIFADEFNDDSNKWSLGCSKAGVATIYYGNLSFKSTSSEDAAGCVRSLFHIDQRKDFEIETKIKFVSGTDNKALYMVFGKQPSEWSRFNLGISGNGYYIIDKSYNNEYTSIVNWIESNYVKKNEYNTLTIRKVNNTLFYFINTNLVHSMSFESFYGDEIGFQVPPGTELSADYFRAYYLGNYSSNEIEYSSFDQFQKDNFFFDDFNSDANDWANEVTKNGSAYVYGGNLIFKSTNPDGAAGCIKNLADFDSGKDFEIETSIRFNSGDAERTIYLIFGKSLSEWNRYNLGFRNDGNYIVDKSYNNEYTDILPRTFSKVVRQNTFNKLTVRKVQNTLYYYVNETQIYSMPFAPFYGNVFGFQVPQGTEIAVDYLRLSYLNKIQQIQKDIIAPEITLLEPYIGKEQKISETNKQIIVKGKVTDASGIYEVVVNGVEAAIDQNGNFQQAVKLAVGDNTVSVRATDTKDNSSFYTFYVNREVTNTVQIQPQDIKPMFNPNEKRIALVIGNSTYSGGQFLKNPENDANLMIQSLKNLGFEVISKTNADKKNMERAIREFSEKLPNYNVALFYYAGHGVQVDGMNYLIPTDADLTKKEDCKWEAISVNFIVEEFEKYPNNTNIVILDACRNDPFRSWSRGGERGFKAIVPTSGTIIAFATSEGATASDGSGVNGLFTQELVKQMQIQQPIESVFKKTRVEVEKISNGTQSPQEWSKLKGDFWFKK
ncbi:MAG: caspase family protein [Bacteroidales bacterium]